MAVTRYLPAAQLSAQIIQEHLQAVGLSADIAHYVLTETDRGHTWLFTVFNQRKLTAIDTYLLDCVLAELTRSLQRHRTVICKRKGLRLAVRLA